MASIDIEEHLNQTPEADVTVQDRLSNIIMSYRRDYNIKDSKNRNSFVLIF